MTTRLDQQKIDACIRCFLQVLGDQIEDAKHLRDENARHCSMGYIRKLQEEFVGLFDVHMAGGKN
jgi:hypothetical protein